MNVGTLTIEMAADLARLRQDMDDAKRTVGSAMDEVRRVADGAGQALAALGLAASAAGLAAFVKDAISSAAGLKDLSEKTGVSVEALSALKSVAKLSGTSMDEVGSAIQKLSKNMVEAQSGSGAAAAGFKALGISVTDGSGKLKSADAVLLEVAQALGGFSDGASKTAVMMAVLGKSGANLAPVMNDLADRGNLVGKVTTEQAQAADEYEKKVIKLQGAMRGWFNGVVLELLPMLPKLAGLLKIAAEATAAYFALFVAGPAVIGVAVSAFNALALAYVEAGTLGTLFGGGLRSLWATITSTATSIGTLKLALAGLMAGFLVFEVAKWAYDNFEPARNVMNAFFAAGMKGWEYLKYGTQVAWLGIKEAIFTVLELIGSANADMIAGIGRGLKMIGAEGAGKAVSDFAESVRSSTKNTQDFKLEMTKLDQQLGIGLSKVDAMKGKLDEESTAHFKAGESAAKHGKDLVFSGEASDEAAKSHDKLIKTLQQLAKDGKSKADADAMELAGQAKLTELQKKYLPVLEALRDGKVSYLELQRAGILKTMEEALAKDQETQAEKERVKWLEEATKAAERQFEQMQKETAGLVEQIDKQRETNLQLSLSAEAWGKLEVQRLRATAAGKLASAAFLEEHEQAGKETAEFKAQAEELNKLADLKEQGIHLKAAKESAEEWKKTTDSIYNGLTDSLMRAFESGKGFAAAFKDTLVNAFKTMILRPTIQAALQPVGNALGSVFGVPGAGGMGGLGNLLGGAGGLGDLFSSGAKGLGSLFSSAGDWMSDGMGNLGTGPLADLGGWLSSTGQGLGSLSGLGDLSGMLGNGLGYLGAISALSQGKIGAGLGAGIGTAFGGPLGGAIGGMLGGAVDSLFGGDGKDYYGADYMASSKSGGYRPAEREVGDRQYGWSITGARSTQVETALKGLTDTSVTLLSSLQAAFGGSSEFKVGTYFSNNGEVGQGNIKVLKDGQVLTASSSGSYGSDATASFKKYSGDVAAAVRSAMDQIQLPEWAKKQLAALGTSATMEELTQTVSAIEQTKVALVAMGSAFTPLGGVFAQIGSLSDEAKIQLAGFAGGVDALISKTQSFVDNYYSDGEKNAISAAAIKKRLTDAGITADLGSREDLKALYESLSGKLDTETGRKQLAALLDIGQAFAPLGDYLKSQGKTLDQLAAQAPQSTLVDTLVQQQASASASADRQQTALDGLQQTMQGTSDLLKTGFAALGSLFGERLSALETAIARNGRDIAEAITEGR